MPFYIACPKCEGLQHIPVDPEDPDGEQQECPECKDSGRPGHIYREYLA